MMSLYKENLALSDKRRPQVRIQLEEADLTSHIATLQEVQKQYSYHDFEIEVCLEQDGSCAGMCGLVDDYAVLYVVGYENNDSILDRLCWSHEKDQMLVQVLMEERCQEEENPNQ